MNKWVIMATSMSLAGCSFPPQVIQTNADPHSIELFVQNARFVPLQAVEDRALQHCADHGLVSRRVEAAWASTLSMTFRFDCVHPHRPSLKLADRKADQPHNTPQKESVAKPLVDGKQAAWNQANAMSSGWHKCVLDEATRVARISSESPDVAAIAVAATCSEWEHDVQQVLNGAGERDSEFQADLHRQVIEFATAKIVSVRATLPLAVNQ